MLTHHRGSEYEFLVGAMGLPGPLITVREPNGNRTRINYDYSGLMTSVITDLDQEVIFCYNADSRMSTVTDHIGRTWQLSYDADQEFVLAASVVR